MCHDTPGALSETVCIDPCLYGALKAKCGETGVPMCGEFGLSFDEFSAVRKRARAASAKAHAQLGRSTWSAAKEVRLVTSVIAIEASVDRAAIKAATFWQRVSAKFCDPDLNWTITAKIAQMRSSQRAKRFAKCGSAVVGLDGDQQVPGTAAMAFAEDELVRAESCLVEMRTAHLAVRKASDSFFVQRQQASDDLMTTKHARAKAFDAQRCLRLALASSAVATTKVSLVSTASSQATDAATAAVLAATVAAAAVSDAVVVATDCASAVAAAELDVFVTAAAVLASCDVSTQSSTAFTLSTQVVKSAKDFQHDIAGSLVIAWGAVKLARSAVS